jgi:hypothetical protein
LTPQVSTSVLYVDNGLSIDTDDQDGSAARPFKTVQQALDALPVATTTLGMLATPVIRVASGVYDEDLTPDLTGKRIRIELHGVFRLGDYSAVGGNFNDASPRRNITFVGDSATVGSTLCAFKMAHVDAPQWDAATVQISGKVDANSLTLGNHVALQLTGNIEGTTGDDTGVSIDTTSHLVGGKSFVLGMTSALLVGAINAPSLVIGAVQYCTFGGGFAIKGVHLIKDSKVDKDITITDDWMSPSRGQQGYVGVRFEPGITFTGPAGTFKVDAISNYWAITNDLALAGGATVDYQGVGKTCVFDGGGTPTAALNYEAHAASGGTASASFDHTTQVPSSMKGRLTKLSWMTADADATTVMEIMLDGSVVDTVTLPGASGTIALPLQALVDEGELLAVRHASGTAPGAGTVRLCAQ